MPYPDWMNGDQLAAEAERRFSASGERITRLAAQADALLEAGDFAAPVPGIGSIGEMATCMPDEWYVVQDKVMAYSMAGHYKQAAIAASEARQIMRAEIIKNLTAR